MSLAPKIPSAPLVTDILFVAHAGGRQIALEFLDGKGDSLASGLTDARALEGIGRQALAVAAAARACDTDVVPIGRSPRARAGLFPYDTLPPDPILPGTASDADAWGALDAEARALAYMIVSVAALLLAVALVAWSIWA